MKTLRLKKTIETIRTYKCELCNRDDGIEDDIKYFYHDDLMVCESCITDIDKSEITGASIMNLYLDGSRLSNGSNTFYVDIDIVKKSDNKMFGTRYDMWFKYDGKNWHGVKMGNDYFNVVKCKVKKI
jgi:hypothetical protein